MVIMDTEGMDMGMGIVPSQVISLKKMHHLVFSTDGLDGLI